MINTPSTRIPRSFALTACLALTLSACDLRVDDGEPKLPELTQSQRAQDEQIRAGVFLAHSAKLAGDAAVPQEAAEPKSAQRVQVVAALRAIEVHAGELTQELGGRWEPWKNAEHKPADPSKLPAPAPWEQPESSDPARVLELITRASPCRAAPGEAPELSEALTVACVQQIIDGRLLAQALADTQAAQKLATPGRPESASKEVPADLVALLDQLRYQHEVVAARAKGESRKQHAGSAHNYQLTIDWLLRSGVKDTRLPSYRALGVKPAASQALNALVRSATALRADDAHYRYWTALAADMAASAGEPGIAVRKLLSEVRGGAKAGAK